MPAMTEGPRTYPIPPSWGCSLTDADYANLATSWITKEIADRAMLRRVDTFEGREIIGQGGKRDCAGLLFSYYWPGESHAHSHRIRRDNPDWTEKNGKVIAKAKYLGAPGSANRLYIPLGIALEQLDDVQVPIVIVEGEKKALALWRLANHAAERPRFVPIAISGVWNWLGTIGKTGGPKGERLDVKGPIADLNRIPWGGRKIFIIFDTNIHTNDSVKWARKGISRELATRRAEVHLVNLPEDCGVNGVDDLLAKSGPEPVLKLFAAAVPGTELRVVVPPSSMQLRMGCFELHRAGSSSRGSS